MKKMTCAQMGGPCEMEMSADNWDAMVAAGMEHLQANHPEMVEAMKTQTPEEMAKWSEEKKAVFDALPDAQ
ncbi:MAG: DUF1059 domain-containing protein [Candidatus Pacebacteria bacterium]|nr:DUF1059 domain-containing protein [Candidatus Paceibacterota bacterium]